jgi:sugar phosphate isomerase/epimerase
MNFPIRPVMDELAEFYSLGFDYMELSLDPPQAHHDRIRAAGKQIRRQLRECGMGLVIHLPTFVLTADLTESIRKASVDEMLRSMDLAAEMAAEKVVMHPSAVTGLAPLVMDLAMGYAKESMEQMIAHAWNLGLRVCLENMFPRYRSFFEPAHFLALFDEHPGLEMTLDTGHANIDGGSDRIFEFIRRHGSRIGHVHASDNDGKRDEHLPIGEGNIDFQGVMRRLATIGYGQTITLEVFAEDRSRLAKSRDRLRKMAAKSSGSKR